MNVPVTHPNSSRRLVLLLIVLLPFVLFAEVSLGNKTFYFQDYQYDYFPRISFLADSIKSLQNPTWNPYTFAGFPQLADLQNWILNPIAWLSLLIPPSYAAGIIVLLYLSIAGAGMYAFSRRLSLSAASGLVMSASYMFSGFMIGHIIHPTIVAGAAWLPWIFALFTDFYRERRGSTLATLTLLLVFQILSGHPQVPCYTAIALFCSLCVSILCETSPSRIRKFCTVTGWALVSYAIAALITSPLLIGLFEAFDESRRLITPEWFKSQGSLSGMDLMLFLNPFTYPVPYLDQELFKDLHVGTRAVWELTGYVGIIPLSLALIALFKGKRAQTEPVQQIFLFSFAILVCGFLIATSSATGIDKIIYHIPILGGMRAHARGLVLVSFSLATLSGLGLNLLASSQYRTNAKRLILPLLTLFAVLDLAYFSTHYFPLTERLEFNQSSAIKDVMISDPHARKASLAVEAPGTVSLARNELFGSWASAEKIQDLNGYNSLEPARFNRLIYNGSATDIGYGLLSPVLFQGPRRKLLDLFGVKYLTARSVMGDNPLIALRLLRTEEGLSIYENLTVLPRTFLVSEIQVAESDEVLKRMNSEVDYRRIAFVEPDSTVSAASYSQQGSTTITKYTNNHVTLEIACESACFVVLTDRFYPGWTAKRGNIALPIHRTNYLFRGIEVPAGKSIVEFSYRPKYLSIGLVLSLAGIVGLILLAFAKLDFLPGIFEFHSSSGK